MWLSCRGAFFGLRLGNDPITKMEDMTDQIKPGPSMGHNPSAASFPPSSRTTAFQYDQRPCRTSDFDNRLVQSALIPSRPGGQGHKVDRDRALLRRSELCIGMQFDQGSCNFVTTTSAKRAISKLTISNAVAESFL